MIRFFKSIQRKFVSQPKAINAYYNWIEKAWIIIAFNYYSVGFTTTSQYVTASIPYLGVSKIMHGITPF